MHTALPSQGTAFLGLFFLFLFNLGYNVKGFITHTAHTCGCTRVHGCAYLVSSPKLSLPSFPQSCFPNPLGANNAHTVLWLTSWSLDFKLKHTQTLYTFQLGSDAKQNNTWEGAVHFKTKIPKPKGVIILSPRSLCRIQPNTLRNVYCTAQDPDKAWRK